MEQQKDALLAVLRSHKRMLTNQEFKTIRGQILAGNAEGAKKGLERTLARKSRPGGEMPGNRHTRVQAGTPAGPERVEHHQKNRKRQPNEEIYLHIRPV